MRTTGSKLNYATTLWDYINRAMPLNREGTLTADEVYSLTAYLLFINDVIKEDEVLDAGGAAGGGRADPAGRPGDHSDRLSHASSPPQRDDG